MNGLTNAYLSLTALPTIGGLALDGRPAFVFAADGSRLLWSNAAGVAFFEASGMGDLLASRFSRLNPLTSQISRLSRLLPSDAPRMEILRIGRGTRLTTLPAACRRVNLPEGERAVLAVAAGQARPMSLRARAERLVDAIAAPDCLVAVMARDGRVLAASGGTADLAPVEPAIDELFERAAHSQAPFQASQLMIDDVRRPAGIARFNAAGEDLFLIAVGPADNRSDPVAVPARTVAAAIDEPVAPAEDLSEAEIAGAPPSATGRTTRFVWETDEAGRITFVSPGLERAVGHANAALVGRTWDEIAGVLGLDLPQASASGWTASVRWPLVDRPETVAVELIALPEGGQAAGQRGFATILFDQPRRDDRQERPTLAGKRAPEGAAEPTDETEAGPTAKSTVADDAGSESTTVSDGQAPIAAGDLDDAARRMVEAGPAGDDNGRQDGTDDGSGEAHEAQAQPTNVVRLPGSDAAQSASQTPSYPLAGHERDAFRRIGETLNASGEEDAASQAPAAPAERAAPAPASPVTAAILDRVPIGLIVFRNSTTLFSNRVLVDMLGYDSGGQLADAGGVAAVFPDQDNGWTGRNLTGAGVRLFAARRDGGTLAVNVRLHSVDWAGATALMLSVGAEAPHADSKDLAAELASAMARADELEAVLDTATDGVVVIDGKGTIANLNRAAEALFGVEAADMIGRAFTDLLAEESQRAALDYLDGLAANGVASVLNDGREVIGKVPRGGLIPLFMTMGRVGDGNMFCAVLRDITYWKNVEEALLAAKREADTANQQKSDFLAKVSHEIRTPLNAIIGFSEVMMEERFGPVGNDRYRSYLRDIHTSGGHLMSLINDLLDLSKIEAGKLELTFESVPVNTAIQECVALMQPQANRERIIIRTSLAADVPNVVADQRSLRQILLNLLSNAVKFTKAGGQVIVSTGLEDNGEVVLRVRDTGIGMSDKDIEAALQPFRQVAATKRDVDKGTGLGLPLTKALVEANRASFAIDSVPEQGTLVRITFPTTRVLAG